MNYLIAGSQSDIGKKLVQLLLEQGHHVYGTSRSEAEFTHPRFTNKIVDFEQDVEFPENFLPDELHGMAYLPGTITLKPFRSLKPEQFLDDLNINFMGAVKSIQWALKRLAEGSSILMFSTVAVQVGMPYHSSIASAKGALEALTRSLAAEFAPKTRVNCIAPSLTDTKLAWRLLSSAERVQSSVERHPLKKIGKVEDIAEMALFLLSDKSKWMSGQIVHVDGGMSSLKA